MATFSWKKIGDEKKKRKPINRNQGIKSPRVAEKRIRDVKDQKAGQWGFRGFKGGRAKDVEGSRTKQRQKCVRIQGGSKPEIAQRRSGY